MPIEVSGSTPKLVGDCSHSKFLPFGAFAVLALYWMAKNPSVHSAVPQIVGLTNVAAGRLSAMVGGQFARQSKATVAKWWSHHVEISGRLTLWLGKRGEQPPP